MEKRHAYLILAHKNFGQLRKLVELLDDPRRRAAMSDAARRHAHPDAAVRVLREIRAVCGE